MWNAYIICIHNTSQGKNLDQKWSWNLKSIWNWLFIYLEIFEKYDPFSIRHRCVTSILLAAITIKNSCSLRLMTCMYCIFYWFYATYSNYQSTNSSNEINIFQKWNNELYFLNPIRSTKLCIIHMYCMNAIWCIYTVAARTSHNFFLASISFIS